MLKMMANLFGKSSKDSQRTNATSRNETVREKAPYYVVGNGVITTKSSEVVKSNAFQKQLKAAKKLQQINTH